MHRAGTGASADQGFEVVQRLDLGRAHVRTGRGASLRDADPAGSGRDLAQHFQRVVVSISGTTGLSVTSSPNRVKDGAKRAIGWSRACPAPAPKRTVRSRFPPSIQPPSREPSKPWKAR